MGAEVDCRGCLPCRSVIDHCCVILVVWQWVIGKFGQFVDFEFWRKWALVAPMARRRPLFSLVWENPPTESGWTLRWVLGQGSFLPLSQGEAFTLASISYLAILVKYILAKKNGVRKKAHVSVFRAEMLLTQYVLSSSRHLVTPFDLHTFLRLTRALCRSLVFEEGVIRSGFFVKL